MFKTIVSYMICVLTIIFFGHKHNLKILMYLNV